jgi:hypothetical protein
VVAGNVEFNKVVANGNLFLEKFGRWRCLLRTENENLTVLEKTEKKCYAAQTSNWPWLK